MMWNDWPASCRTWLATSGIDGRPAATPTKLNLYWTLCREVANPAERRTLHHHRTSCALTDRGRHPELCEIPQPSASRSEMIRSAHEGNFCAPECNRGNVVSHKWSSVRKRVHPMRYESGRPEPNPTVRDIYAAWTLVGAFLLALIVVSFA